MKPISNRNFAALLVSFIVVGSNLNAQTAPTTGAPAQQSRPHPFQNLNLTDNQKAQIKQIRETTPKGKERRQAIMAILTPEQQALAKQDAQQRQAQ